MLRKDVPAELQVIKGGGITSALGFHAAALAAGIKRKGKKDMALIVSTSPAQVAGVFTMNQVKAAPVRLSMQHVRNGVAHGVIINSGNANACTGVQGIKNACEMAELTARAIGSKKTEIMVCSTGRIGVQLPMPKVRRGIARAAKNLTADQGSQAAKAIMTSDTRRKEFAVRFKIDGRKVTIGGMAKGAGMIHPNMATMLGFITTDAQIDKKTLRRCLEESVERTFNRISVDGDTSTNDTVLIFANGLAGNHPLKSYHPQLELFQRALDFVAKRLAQMVVEDGEGASKIVEVAVKGARNHHDAKAAAEAIARSMLVKTSWCGGDANWGRLMDAIGYSRAKVREELVEIYYNGLLAVANGQPSRTPTSKLLKIVRKPNFTITIHLHSGNGEYNLLTADLTEKYVEINRAKGG
jgi:glutamate N-acetyltransferase / amino-acid N-acetyltransferase